MHPFFSGVDWDQVLADGDKVAAVLRSTCSDCVSCCPTRTASIHVIISPRTKSHNSRMSRKSSMYFSYYCSDAINVAQCCLLCLQKFDEADPAAQLDKLGFMS